MTRRATQARQLEKPTYSLRASKAKIEFFEKSLGSLNIVHMAWVSQLDLLLRSLKHQTLFNEGTNPHLEKSPLPTSSLWETQNHYVKAKIV